MWSESSCPGILKGTQQHLDHATISSMTLEIHLNLRENSDSANAGSAGGEREVSDWLTYDRPKKGGAPSAHLVPLVTLLDLRLR